MSNSALHFQKIWRNKIERVQRLIRRLPRDLGNEALLFFLNLFKKEESPEGERWPQRKNATGDRTTRRGLLVKSGRLRKSIKLNIEGARIRIGTSTPYAKYHNEGTNRIPQRKFIGRSKALERRLQRMIKAKILWELRK